LVPQVPVIKSRKELLRSVGYLDLPMSNTEQPTGSEEHDHHDVEGPGYATPQAAIE
jgi:hypothetical protein